MDLPIATEGPCAGHECDDCAICRRGHCCRRDNPGYRLPQEGEWDGPIYGEIGALADDGGRVECHCCGEWFRCLATHVFWRHDLTAAEYKAIFGLRRRAGLTSSGLHRRYGEIAAEKRARGKLRTGGDALARLTPEQRFAFAHRPMRTQSRRAVSAARGGWKSRACSVCGTVFVHKWAAKVQTCSRLCLSELRRRLRTGTRVSDEARANMSAARRRVAAEKASGVRS